MPCATNPTKASAPSTRSARFERFATTALYEKPRYVTKQAAKLMDHDGKLDLLLRKMEETEKKREESDKRLEKLEEQSRAEFLALKLAVESRIPAVEKHVDLLHGSVVDLQEKMEKLQSVVQDPSRECSPAPDASGQTFSTPSPTSPNHDSDVLDPTLGNWASAGNTSGIGGSVPPMSCPQFDGDNPQMWKCNCEEYFEVYGINPKHWVRVAGLNFTGNAAFWLQSMRSKLVEVSWGEFTEHVCLRFTKDRQEVLIRQWFHMIQDSSVSAYVEKFDSVMHQLLAYNSSLPLNYFVTKFVEGLKKEIRSGVLMQKPQDLDSACSLALLQEEILEGVPSVSLKRVDSASFVKQFPRQFSLGPSTPKPVSVMSPESQSAFKVRADKLAALKSYRRSKGLCFTCGERWSREHKCSPSVQLHIVQELLEALQQDDSHQELADSDSVETVVMALSQQAFSGTESVTSFRLRGWVQGIEVLMLVDSGSSHSFLDVSLTSKLKGIRPLLKSVSVKVADGGILSCSSFIPACTWCTQGQYYQTEFKILPLGAYDVILGMDWLASLGQMHVDWFAKWMEFVKDGHPVKL